METGSPACLVDDEGRCDAEIRRLSPSSNDGPVELAVPNEGDDANDVCGLCDPPIKPKDQAEEERRRDFVGEEVEGADFGDARLKSRLAKILADMSADPEGSIPEVSGDWAGTKGAYRFCDNARVTPEKILNPHLAKTIERCLGETVVLAVADTTSLDFSRHENMKGTGPLAMGRRGLMVQTTLAVTPQRECLGVLDVNSWSRQDEDYGNRAERCRTLPIQEKESNKWLVSLDAARNLREQVGAEGPEVFFVADREADIFVVLAKATALREEGIYALVRSMHNRRIVAEHDQRLWDFVTARPVAKRIEVEVPRKGNSKPRKVTLAIRYSPVTLPPAMKLPKREERFEAIEAWAVMAEEVDPPEGTPKICWKLLTTKPITSGDQASQIVHYYVCRWIIEVYFRVLKTGCRVEERQFETAERLTNCLILDSLVAWMVMYLTTSARAKPDEPCTRILDDRQWQTAWMYFHRTKELPSTPPTMMAMARIIGQIGGHLGRKNDGPPGATTIWRGLRKLRPAMMMWEILASGVAPDG